MTHGAENKIEALIELAENSGRTHPDGSTDKDPGLNNKERARIDDAAEKAKESGDLPETNVDDDGPSHMASILNKVGEAAEDAGI